jgi:hypothetical protein
MNIDKMIDLNLDRIVAPRPDNSHEFIDAPVKRPNKLPINRSMKTVANITNDGKKKN